MIPESQAGLTTDSRARFSILSATNVWWHCEVVFQHMVQLIDSGAGILDRAGPCCRSQALERTDRRYLWLRKRLGLRADIWRIFPDSWSLQQQLCLTFCSITRAQLADILQAKVRRPTMGHAPRADRPRSCWHERSVRRCLDSPPLTCGLIGLTGRSTMLTVHLLLKLGRVSRV